MTVNTGTPPEGGQVSESTPAEEGGQGFDYERGYSELRPKFTQTAQELSTTRTRLSEYEQLFEALHDNDPEVQSAALEALGLEFDTGSPGSAPATDEFVDPLEAEVKQLRSVVDELRSARELETASAEERRLTQMRDDFIGEAIGLIETTTKVKFSEREEEALGNLAITMTSQDGTPDVQGAYNLLYGSEGVFETALGRRVASKNAAQPPIGTSIPADQKPQSKNERISYIDERMRAIEDQL